MRQVKVTNTGRRVRDRLGIVFNPKEEHILDVNNRQYVTLKAVKDFKVEVIEVEKPDNPPVESTPDAAQEEPKTAPEQAEPDFATLSVDKVLEAVDSGAIEVDKAIALEVAGKGRATLLDKLEARK